MRQPIPPRTPERYEEATSLFTSGRLPEALALLEECVYEVPEHVGARFGLGVCYDRTGDAVRAENLYRSVLVLDPSHVNGHLHLGALLEQQARPAEAVTIYRSALALNPESAKARSRIQALEAATQHASATDSSGVPPVMGATPAAGVPPVTGAPPLPTLAATLDSDETSDERLSMAGDVLHTGRRRLLSHGRLWAGFALLLCVPLLGGVSRLANSTVDDQGTSQTHYDTVRAFDELAYAAQYVIVLVAAFLALAAMLSTVFTRYTVRERRVDIAKGVLFRSERYVWLYDVNDIQFSQSPLLLLAGTGNLTLMVDEANASPKTAPTLLGFGGTRFLRGLAEELQPIVLRERRAMKKQFV